MRVRLVIGSLALVALVPLALLESSCSSSDTASVDDSDGSTPPGSNPDDGGGDGATGGDARPPAPPNDCKLGELAGVADVAPTFVTYEPPGTAPPAMTGGTLSGNYKVDKAKVFLPTMTKGLADPTKSTGTVNAWAIFNGKNYRLFLKSTFTVSSVLGPQMQANDVASQGGFTVQTSALNLDLACDATLPTTAATYTFTDDGSGRATILIKTTSTYGDTYLQLDAKKD